MTTGQLACYKTGQIKNSQHKPSPSAGAQAGTAILHSNADFKHCIDHYRHIKAQPAHSHHRAPVLARVAQHFKHQVGAAIEHFGEFEEIGRRAWFSS